MMRVVTWRRSPSATRPCGIRGGWANRCHTMDQRRDSIGGRESYALYREKPKANELKAAARQRERRYGTEERV